MPQSVFDTRNFSYSPLPIGTAPTANNSAALGLNREIEQPLRDRLPPLSHPVMQGCVTKISKNKCRETELNC